MSTSLTITLSGKTSTLSAFFHPEIELDERYNYSCALLDFFTYNTIPNIHEKNNKFYYKRENDSLWSVITVPVGSYELRELLDILEQCFRIEERTTSLFNIQGNRNTMKCKAIFSEVMVDFTRNDCLGPVLGFGKRILEPGEEHESDNPICIQSINSIRIDCDLTSGSYHNGKVTHTLYEFSPSVDPGYKIVEQPTNLIYLPIITRRINTLNISIVDQEGEPIDFRGEEVSCRIHIKREA